MLPTQAHTPEQQCRVISHWLNLAGGVLFPLALLWRWERRARRLHRQRMRRQHGEQQLASWPHECWWERTTIADHACPWLQSLLLLCFGSSLIWIGAHAL